MQIGLNHRAEVRVFTVADRRVRFTIAIPRDCLAATAERDVRGVRADRGVVGWGWVLGAGAR